MSALTTTFSLRNFFSAPNNGLVTDSDKRKPFIYYDDL